MNILFLNVGRRCELVREFKKVLPSFPGGGLVYGSDVNPLAPALSKVDESVIFPHSSDKAFPSAFISFCKENNITLVIPTIDPDLRFLSAKMDLYKQVLPDTKILVPSWDVVQLTEDKRKTKEFFAENGALVPQFVNIKDEMKFPVFVKPARGSAGEGAIAIRSMKALKAHLSNLDEPMIEELVLGPEYTVDVFCDLEKSARLAIPRKRLAVRGGEVSRGVIERNVELEKLACKLAEKLGSDLPITIQFRKSAKGFVAMEINARIGGGLPLTIAAGGEWPKWILQMACGLEPDVQDKVRNGILMTRYDESVILEPIMKTQESPDLSKVKLIIFDMDDTLYPEKEFVYSGYKAVSRFVLDNYGLFIEDELKRRFDDGQRGDLFSVVLNSFGLNLSESKIKELVSVYREHIPVIRPYSDVSLISKFKAAGYKLGLISDGWASVQKNKWSSLGLNGFFDYVLFTDDLGREFWKPHPKAFEKMVDMAGVTFEESVYVADNPVKDFEAPNKLGMHSLRVVRYGGEHSKLKPSKNSKKSSYEIKSINELNELLEQSANQEGELRVEKACEV